MTDDQRGRIDLRAIDDEGAARAELMERTISGALTRIAALPTPRYTTADVLARRGGPLGLAAAVVAAVAIGIILADRSGGAVATTTSDPVAAVAAWADALYVPTNGELLATFHGYAP